MASPIIWMFALLYAVKFRFYCYFLYNSFLMYIFFFSQEPNSSRRYNWARLDSGNKIGVKNAKCSKEFNVTYNMTYKIEKNIIFDF